MLSGAGYTAVESTLNPSVVCGLHRSKRYDLILLDLMMPTLDGFGALEMFRGLLETKASKIIIMSALSQPYDIAKAKALGADDYIVKSQVLIDDVMEIIKRHLTGDAGDDMTTPPPGTSVTPTAG